MKVEKVCLKDVHDTIYVFTSSGEVFIEGKKGRSEDIGRLITPISKLSLTSVAYFMIGNKKFKTAKLKGCFVD